MDKIQCVLADDEPIARQILERYIAQSPHLELVSSCRNAFEVIEVMQEKKVDLLFLDINMPELSGLNLLKTMHQSPHVIITTAYSEYAVEGFELSVVDYLLKPFSFERFLQAVLKVPRKNPVPASVSVPSVESKQDFIFVKSDKKVLKIKFSDISHVEAYGNYVKIMTDTTVLTPYTLSEFLTKLPSDFLRIHKSFIINFNQLQAMEGNQLVLDNGVVLPIGKAFKKNVVDRIEGKEA